MPTKPSSRRIRTRITRNTPRDVRICLKAARRKGKKYAKEYQVGQPRLDTDGKGSFFWVFDIEPRPEQPRVFLAASNSSV